uniref:Protein MAK16 homolog n=1 Tax=Ditylum brightwellii TaxID=49249 RepID=A0A6V2BPM5_9STRA|mmetsp:Transcript_17179/g.24943  ORF Transcript_17179/g.24943 Transcript_17179/m.24943 type:complete len:358 (+) Transcript_17179:160-1233(+)
MQHDEMIWQVINHQFCSFKTTIGVAKSEKREFCRHPYSITGLCNRSHCPLANSRYGVVREENGRINLYIKTVERAHSPKNLWEKIQLSRNYTKALGQLDEHLAFFPKPMVHRNKQRLTKIHQYLLRMRKIKLKEMAGKKAKKVGINRKIEQREERREKKALIAAKIEQNVEKELLERLARGTYGDIYNFPEVPYQKALEQVEESEEEEEEESEDEEEEMEGAIEYVEDLEEEEDDEEDIEDMEYAGEGNWVNPGSDDEEESESDEDDDSEEDESDSDEEGSSDDNEDEDDESGSDKDSDDDAKDEPKKKKTADDNKRRKSEARRRPKRGTRVEIEYEEENEGETELQGGESIAGAAW